MLLLAAILVTLIGAWRIAPGILSAVVGVILWIVLAGMAWRAMGTPALVAFVRNDGGDAPNR